MKKIIHAQSSIDGITFYSNILPELGTKVTIDENGKFLTTLTTSDIEKQSCRKSTHYLLKRKILYIIDAVLLIFSLVLSILFKKILIFVGTGYFVFFTSYLVFDTLNISYSLKYKNTQKYTIAKFHGAEHMAINAYEKLGHIPTLSEIKKFSRFNKDCGSRILITRTVTFILLFLNTFVPPPYGIFTIMLIFILVLINTQINFLRFLQVFFVSKPTDTELLLAIECLTEYEKNEKMCEEIAKIQQINQQIEEKLNSK